MNSRKLGLILSIAMTVAACGGGAGDNVSDTKTASSHDAQALIADGTAKNTNCAQTSYGAAPAVRGALPAGTTLTLTDATTKVRADVRPDVTPIAEIKAARNEYEMFQLVVRSNTALRIDDVHFELPTLPRAGLSDVDRVMIYRAGYMSVTQTSNSEGARGLWPDALIPKIDSYACETRNAFPIDVPAGRNQSFYIDVYVPRGAAPGRYAGHVTLSGSGAQGAFVQRQALDLEVWNFTMPSTSSLQSVFGFNGDRLLQGHHANAAAVDNRRLSALYTKSGLRHRVGMSSGLDTELPYTYRNGVVTIDWRGYDEELTPYLDGSAHHTGATWSTVQLRSFNPPIYQTDGAAGLTAYTKAWVEHARAGGYYDKLWGYTLDEPRAPQFAEVRDRARAMLAADPDFRPLVTSNVGSGLGESPETSPIRIWTPVVNHMNRTARASYEPYIRKGAELWWYQSCESHGCEGDEVSGYPSYMIDVGGASNRVMEWLSFAYDMRGELYFNTMEAYFRVGDAWDTQFLFNGNGDGTLLYPGRPDRIGGKTHIPVESLRLKLIREGYEDYEYLRLLAQSAADRPFLDRQVASVARAPTDFSHDPQAFYRARQAIGNRIAELVTDGALIDRKDGQ